MQHKVTVSTDKNKIFFFTKCDYSYRNNESAQIKFEYQGDFSKYNIIIGVNHNKLSLALSSKDEDGNEEHVVHVMPLNEESTGARKTTVTFEYLKFIFSPTGVVVDFNENFAKIALTCLYAKGEREEPKQTVLRIDCRPSNL